MLKNKKHNFVFISIIILVFIFNSNFLYAQDTDNLDVNKNNNIDNIKENLGEDYDVDFILNNPNKAKELFNKHINQVPDFVKKFLAKESIKLKIKDENGNYSVINIVTDNGLIKTISDTNLNKYSLEVELSKKRANELIKSKDPSSVFKDIIHKKELKLKGVGFFNSIKYFFVNLITNFI